MYIIIINVSFHYATVPRAFPVHATFSDLDHISRLQQCQAVSSQNCMFKLCSVVKFVVYIMNIPLYSLSHLFKGATIN